MESRGPVNFRLRALLAEAGLTGEELARRVNRLGQEAGLRLRYRRASVTQWMSGTRPRPPVPELVAEAFSRALGRRVTVEETGLARQYPPGADLGPWWDVDATAHLADLAAADEDVLTRSVYDLDALSVPRLGDVVAVSGPAPRRTRNRVGRAETEAAAAMLRLFSNADNAFGGGHVRPALLAYLRSAVVPWLRATASPGVRRDLLAAASKLTYLGGFTCSDDELHGTAQRYYLIGLRFAAESGDTIGYAVSLRALSVQAYVLGHGQQAAALAESAVLTAAASVPGQTRAFLLGQLAVTDAVTGDRQAASTHIRQAERSLDQAEVENAAIGAYHFSSLVYQQAVIAGCLGDTRTAIEALRLSVRHRPADERRSRMITLARLAELEFAEGEPQRAFDDWNRFLDDYPQVRSRRTASALIRLNTLLWPHRADPVAGALLDRARTVAAAD